MSKQPINVNVMGKEIPQGGIWAQVRVGPGRSGVGRKEILREVIGPGSGRVPGLFRQKRGNIIQIRQSIFINANSHSIPQQLFVLPNSVDEFFCL